ncbi:AAA family ATPase [Synechococcus sp. Cruz-9H2]|nr:AAA family ATPase [Synechococcus sp. Cruz-9H2]MCP9842730.1 AAA family ATPase [Synechococcus sp. Edmonson 11F2]MCP9855395.1 AAA family ATPase [Synechococcus sp. Cruz-9C9]MCP9862358.1 AAA family ATPase [Synechococcus sp. Cruz-7E5]MCP9869630.1 AAA family ATPase [Synechococcus sp. Cruz-7B9]
MTPQPPALSPLGRALAEALPRLYGIKSDPLLAELIEALSAALVRGELHLPLDGPVPEGIVSLEHWPEGHRQALMRCGWIQGPQQPAPPADDSPPPLMLSERGVGWRRWLLLLESTMAELEQRATACVQPPLSPKRLEAAALLAQRRGGLDSHQQAAVAALLRQGLVLLGGGPGTGKTSTIVQMLAAVLEERPGWRLHLAAPTGKAAARLRQAIAAGGSTLSPDLAAQLTASPCTTLHRLLESRGEGFGRNRERPLELDLLVVDEVSMLDLPLMAALLEALPAEAQLLLVGDPDQLAPVGPGAVLQELQAPARRHALGDASIELSTTYRNDGAVALAAGRLRRGDTPGFLQQLSLLEASDNLSWWRCAPGRLPVELLARLRAHQQQLAQLAARWSEDSEGLTMELLEEVERCVVLAPTRRGRWGVESLNQRLLGADWSRGPAGWPPGTPVLCQRNLPEQGLANGDVGVVVMVEGQRRLLFWGSQDPGEESSGGNGAAGGRSRLVHPSRMAAAEAAFAITIHKSQGSQYQQVLVLMPEREGHWDQRLLYTALTRARQQAVLITPEGQGWLPA